MNLPIEELLNVLRNAEEKSDPWHEILQICSRAAPSGFWKCVPKVDVEKDVEFLVREVLPECLGESPKGICLGLDTLNMEGEEAFNIEIGLSNAEECVAPDPAWVYSELNIFGQTLLPGIKNLNAAYTAAQWESIYQFCDYVLPLTYSGLVFSRAMSRVTSKSGFAIAWGFSSGDMFLLGRHSGSQFVPAFTYR